MADTQLLTKGAERTSKYYILIITKNYVRTHTHVCMYVCKYTLVCKSIHIHISKPPGGSANHYHHDRNIFALYVSNTQHLKWKARKIIRDANCFSRIS